eukprot:jgi/Bigna1/75774/fgenesh1_pg.37_\
MSDDDDSDSSDDASSSDIEKDVRKLQKKKKSKKKKKKKEKKKKAKLKKEKKKQKEKRKKKKRKRSISEACGDRRQHLEPYTSTATEILPKDRVTRGQIAQSSDIKEAQTNKEPAIPEAPIIKKVKKRVFGAMRPEEAKRIEEDGKKIRRVWDPDLGVHRLQRLNGEIVEECVSKDKQRELILQKSRYIRPSQYTGKHKVMVSFVRFCRACLYRDKENGD